MSINDKKSNTVARPPVVAVMGHIDHGKSTLLDYIRKTNVVDKETGGITQAISAYEVVHKDEKGADKKITFLDTPGHEAFSKMRARGVNVADIAIVVVAIDDGVQPQTKEAIKIVQEAEIPYVVALNKIDKENIDINKVKNELTSSGVLLEGYGGSVSFQPVSAKSGQGVNELLDLVLLTAEVADITAHPEVLGQGVILEAWLDKRRGILASVLVKDGTLQQGIYIRAGGAVGKVKGLEDFTGKRITEAGPSTPVLIYGFELLPKVGDAFETNEKAFPSTPIEKNIPTAKKPAAPIATAQKEERATLRLMLKADVAGSLEALEQVIMNIPKPNVLDIEIMDRAVGDISDGDVKFGDSYGAIIVGFKTGITKAAQTLAEAQRVRIVTSDIVYDLVKTLEEEFKRLDQGVVKGDLEILAVFGKKGGAQIVGGKVAVGVIPNRANIGIERKGNPVGVGKIVNLQSGKKDVVSLTGGLEGGLLLDTEVAIKVGDHLIVR